MAVESHAPQRQGHSGRGAASFRGHMLNDGAIVEIGGVGNNGRLKITGR
jgi:hypothetical protein